MICEKIIALVNTLEDSRNPSLGPTLKALYLFGLWQTGSTFRFTVYNVIHVSSIFFSLSQFIDLYFVKDDVNKILDNMSLSVLSVICVAKCFSYVLCQKKWKKLVRSISEEELCHVKKKDPLVQKYVNSYIKYTRIVTYTYWLMVFGTNTLLIASPFLKFLSSQSFRNEIRNGRELLPQIFSSWFPFDNNKYPGYLVGIVVHIIMGSQGSGVIAAYDTNSVAILSYFKGQMTILRHKCINIFEKADSFTDILERIKECHRHHTVLIKQYKMFNSLLSTTMFFYVLLCSITICGSVVQFNSKEASTSQKLWVTEYTSGLVAQLFLYCWHSNEVTIQSLKIDRGIYNSDWWRGDVLVRKQLLLLAGKLNYPFILDAGPYASLSVSTFISILKGSYSFYTLFSEMKHDKDI